MSKVHNFFLYKLVNARDLNYRRFGCVFVSVCKRENKKQKEKEKARKRLRNVVKIILYTVQNFGAG